MLKKFIVFMTILLIIDFIHTPSFVGIFTAFDTKTYTRENAKPKKITETFYVRSIMGNYKLVVENGFRDRR